MTKEEKAVKKVEAPKKKKVEKKVEKKIEGYGLIGQMYEGRKISKVEKQGEYYIVTNDVGTTYKKNVKEF